MHHDRLIQQVLRPSAALWLACFAWGSMLSAQQEARYPVKLAVTSSTLSAAAGEAVEVQVGLEDAAGEAAPAPKELPVRLEVRLPSGERHILDVPFLPGQSSRTARLEVAEPGVVTLTAEQEELRSGGGLLKVRTSATPPTGDGDAVALELLPFESSNQGGSTEEGEPATEVMEDEGPPVVASSTTVHPSVFSSVQDVMVMADVDASPAAAPPPPGPLPRVHLYFNPRRGFLANGRDAATIYAFLEGGPEVAPSEIKIHLTTEGRLEPAPLRISAGEDVGIAVLTSERAGDVHVEYVNSQPASEIVGDRNLEIPFEPPITGLTLVASPPSLSWVDLGELVVQLVDENGIPTTTDRPRPVSFLLEAGQGEIDPKEVVIPAGASEGRTAFQPTWSRGTAKVTAATDGLLRRSVPLEIEVPWLLLGLTAAGGLAGGVIVSFRKKKSVWAVVLRVFIGLITGFLLYWAFIFGLLEQLPRAAVLNPLSAFALATLGGWLGTEVFRLVGKPLGLPT
jgi:hypothetical protein